MRDDVVIVAALKAGLTGRCQVIGSGLSRFVTEYLPNFVASLSSLNE